MGTVRSSSCRDLRTSLSPHACLGEPSLSRAIRLLTHGDYKVEMPGFSLVCRLDEQTGVDREQFLRLLEQSRHMPDYRYDLIHESRSDLLACTRYDGYPVTVIETDAYLIYLEGKLYGWTEEKIRRELVDLAREAFATRPSRERLADWCLSADGEFVVVLRDKRTNEVAIINDVLGRLPVYYHSDAELVAVSRDLAFVPEAAGCREFDTLSLAQYLVLGYALGTKTLISDVFQLAPGSLLRIRREPPGISVMEVHRFDLDDKRNAGVPMRDNARELADRLLAATERRAGDDNLLSLSGGLDSRCVAGAFAAGRLPLTAASYMDGRRKTGEDVRVAEKIAKVAGLEWSVVKLDEPTPHDLLSLLKFKSAQNPLWMSFIVPFYEELRSRHGPAVTHFTGDGGDLFLRSVRPRKELSSPSRMVDRILQKNAFFWPEDIAQLLPVSADSIRDSIEKQVTENPEESIPGKYSHFVLYDKMVNRGFEGEDRNRFFFWGASPFYSIDFFPYAQNCPVEQKRHFALYQEVFRLIAPELLSIERPGGVGTLSSKRHRAIYSVRDAMLRYRWLERAYRRLRAPKHACSPDYMPVRAIREQLKNAAVRDYISAAGFERLMARPEGCTALQVETLVSATSLIELVSSGRSTLESLDLAEDPLEVTAVPVA